MFSLIPALCVSVVLDVEELPFATNKFKNSQRGEVRFRWGSSVPHLWVSGMTKPLKSDRKIEVQREANKEGVQTAPAQAGFNKYGKPSRVPTVWARFLFCFFMLHRRQSGDEPNAKNELRTTPHPHPPSPVSALPKCPRLDFMTSCLKSQQMFLIPTRYFPVWSLIFLIPLCWSALKETWRRPGAARRAHLLRLPSSASWINSFTELQQYTSEYQKRKEAKALDYGTLEYRFLGEKH